MPTRLALLAAALLATLPARAAVLTVEDITQEQDQWCWSACSRCMLLFYGIDEKQCEIAEYTRTSSTTADVNLGTTNCCTSATLGCNTWNYDWGTGGSIEDIMDHFVGATAVTYDTVLPMNQLVATIDAQQLFLIRWQWTDGSGHFLVGHGYDNTTVYYMNPWPGEGLEFGEYTWMESGASHTWANAMTFSVAVTSGCSGKVDGATCDDGDACTLGDACNGGVCASGTAINCPVTACREPDACDHATGQCIQGAALSDGASCSDDNPCTESDRCKGGQCVGTEKTCPAPDACHVGSCDTTSGSCVTTAAADGTACPQGVCTSGTCGAAPPTKLPTSTGCTAAGAGAVAWLGLAGLWALGTRRR